MAKTNLAEKDRHHLCYPKSGWNRGYVKALRDHWYLRATVPKHSLHTEIHRRVTSVPVPRGRSAKAAYEQLLMLEHYGALAPYDTLEKRLSLLVALFDCVEQPTADAFSKQLEIVREFYAPL